MGPTRTAKEEAFASSFNSLGFGEDQFKILCQIIDARIANWTNPKPTGEPDLRPSHIEYGASAGNRTTPPRLPFKESIGSANEKLERLLLKISNFDGHLFPQPTTDGALCPGPSDFAEMIDRTHELISLCELRLDRIRDRF